MNFQMKATDTLDRIVGKKNSERSTTEPRLFLTSRTASASEMNVWKMTTTSMNLRLFVKALRNRSSAVTIRSKLRVPTCWALALKPSQLVTAYCTPWIVGTTKKTM